jgi:phosphatidate cytidylyltransferase
VLVAVPAGVLAIAFVNLGGIGWTILVTAMGCACVSELYQMLSAWRPLRIVGFAAVIGACLAAHWGGEHAVLGAIAASVAATFVALLARGEVPRPTLAIASTLLGVVWIAVAFAHAVLLRQAPHGNGVVIDVMVGTFLADAAAYLGGRMFGRHPLAPAISPNKTVEGLVCGIVVAILSVFCAGLYQSWLQHGTALALGLAIAIAGPLGDLFESMIKRDAGAKDAGSLFGAHGGALDRLDAISFTMVACYYIWIAAPH